MTFYQRQLGLQKAKELLQLSVDLIKKVVNNTTLEARAKAYIIPELTMCISDSHEYLGQRMNLEEMEDALEESAGEEDEEFNELLESLEF